MGSVYFSSSADSRGIRALHGMLLLKLSAHFMVRFGHVNDAIASGANVPKEDLRDYANFYETIYVMQERGAVEEDDMQQLFGAYMVILFEHPFVAEQVLENRFSGLRSLSANFMKDKTEHVVGRAIMCDYARKFNKEEEQKIFCNKL